MEHSYNIEEILAGNYTPPAPKTDRVLKSTRIEQAIFDDLSADAAELAEFSAEGEQKLNKEKKKLLERAEKELARKKRARMKGSY